MLLFCNVCRPLVVDDDKASALPLVIILDDSPPFSLILCLFIHLLILRQNTHSCRILLDDRPTAMSVPPLCSPKPFFWTGLRWMSKRLSLRFIFLSLIQQSNALLCCSHGLCHLLRWRSFDRQKACIIHI